jgi:hypothetical protein
MKRVGSIYLLFLVALTFSSCSDSNEPVAEPGTPEWTAGYPMIPFGAVSVDLILQADKKSKVYWAITDKAITLTPKELRTQTIANTNAAIKFKGIASIDPNTEKIETVSGLTQNKKYFAYLVGESVADTVLQPTIKSFDFTTYYRQDTSSYQSTAENRTVLYLIYRPEDALKYPDKKHPICFFLGGDGDVATPGKINMIHGGTLPDYIKTGNDVPLMVMSIQHTIKNWNATLIEEGITHGLATYPVNTKKVYMTGLSGGGYGVWNYAVAFPSKLTAIVPISGGGNKNKACNIKSISIWAFHNEVDGTVNLVNSQNMVNAVNACSPVEPAKLTIFPDTGHDCWRRVYNKNSPDWLKPGKNGIDKVDIYSWMLSKSK